MSVGFVNAVSIERGYDVKKGKNADGSSQVDKVFADGLLSFKEETGLRACAGRWEIIMGIFDNTEEKLQGLYHRAWVESGRGFVDPRKYPYLDKAIYLYAREYDCSYDEALILAKTGKRTGNLAN